MKRLNLVPLFGILSIACMTMNSCKKESVNPASPSYPYNVKMTDAPGPYSAVNIDLQGVEITGNGGKVVLLNVHKGIYNLLDLSNGIDTLIANAVLNDAKVEQIRLILGSNNSVVIDSVSYPLSTPSAEQSGLKLQIHQTLKADIQNVVLLDFDANKSIEKQGNGTYILKPVIRTIEAEVTGSIRGKISPAGILAVVSATSTVSYYTNVIASGDFLIMGLPAGDYAVTVTPIIPFNSVTLNNITVTTKVVTNIGTINL